MGNLRILASGGTSHTQMHRISGLWASVSREYASFRADVQKPPSCGPIPDRAHRSGNRHFPVSFRRPSDVGRPEKALPYVPCQGGSSRRCDQLKPEKISGPCPADAPVVHPLPSFMVAGFCPPQFDGDVMQEVPLESVCPAISRVLQRIFPTPPSMNAGSQDPVWGSTVGPRAEEYRYSRPGLGSMRGKGMLRRSDLSHPVSHAEGIQSAQRVVSRDVGANCT